jgi:uncharacterized SAM-binding protein YcdF (DUF218 family)
VQGALTALLLPPLVLLWLALGAALLSYRGWRIWGLVAATAVAGVLALATPFVSGHLVASLEREISLAVEGPEPPAAIVILGAEVLRRRDGRRDVGPLSLERLRAGAALHRGSGLPLLVTGGLAQAGEPSLAELMAISLVDDFGVTVRWIEGQATDTRENALFSAAILRAHGIRTAHLVTHGWHMPRAAAAFARSGMSIVPAPLRLAEVPRGRPAEWLPRADQLGVSWLALREWVGRLVYAARDVALQP